MNCPIYIKQVCYFDVIMYIYEPAMAGSFIWISFFTLWLNLTSLLLFFSPDLALVKLSQKGKKINTNEIHSHSRITFFFKQNLILTYFHVIPKFLISGKPPSFVIMTLSLTLFVICKYVVCVKPVLVSSFEIKTWWFALVVWHV